jgi:putative membrane protein
MGWGGWAVMTIVMVVFFAVAIAAVVAAVRYLGAGGQGAKARGGPPARTPEDVLADRFARGEIDDEEYRRRLVLLHEHH